MFSNNELTNIISQQLRTNMKINADLNWFSTKDCKLIQKQEATNNKTDVFFFSQTPNWWKKAQMMMVMVFGSGCGVGDAPLSMETEPLPWTVVCEDLRRVIFIITLFRCKILDWSALESTTCFANLNQWQYLTNQSNPRM